MSFVLIKELQSRKGKILLRKLNVSKTAEQTAEPGIAGGRELINKV